MTVRVKVCGLTTPDAVTAAAGAGADMVGFVLFAPSPRNISVAAAAELASDLPARIETVAVTVDADDSLLAEIAETLRPAFVQAHGAESPARLAEMRVRTGARVIKAIPVFGPDDLARAADYADADVLLFDARPPKGADRPGGHGLAFDWRLLASRTFSIPWMLSGGLDPDNVADAIAASGARAVDVSSGVERAPGVKDADRVRAFLRAAQGATEPA